jgi:hypothetical protein
MQELKSNWDASALAGEASDRYNGAMGLFQEDARLGVKYLILRLELLGLTNDEIADLRRLAQVVFAGADPSTAAQAILHRPSATPLAVVIANVALGAPAESKRAALMGAILGAHSIVITLGGSAADAGVSALAATVGAATYGGAGLIERIVEGDAWQQFASKDA